MIKKKRQRKRIEQEGKLHGVGIRRKATTLCILYQCFVTTM